MDRRGIVALALLTGLSGCSAAGSVSLTPVNDAETLAAEASRSVDDAENPVVAHRQQIVASAIENGAARVNGTRTPIESGLPYARDGTYYDVTGTVVDAGSGYDVELGADYNATDPDGPRVAYEDLPAVDRRAIAPLLTVEPRRYEPGVDWGYSTAYTEDQAAASMLVPEQGYDVVVYRGTAYPIDVDAREESDVNTYRYEATVVANDSTEYADRLDRRYAFRLSNLTAEERGILDEAVGDTYYADSDSDDPFDRLVDRFLGHQPVAHESGFREGTWLVRYDGHRYLVELFYGEFVETTPDVSETPAVTPPS